MHLPRPSSPFRFTPAATPRVHTPIEERDFDKSTIADLVARYGSSSATAWLEFDRYKIWRPKSDIPESSFLPVQGYMRKSHYIFAWGNPLVSDAAALKPTALEFKEWAESYRYKLVWACVDHHLEHVLVEPPFEWSTVTCIYEDVVHPERIMELTSPEMLGKEGGASVVKDLRKNLKRAERAHVEVVELRREQFTEEERQAVEEGIDEWKKTKHGVSLASTSLQPWLDSEHRRYWVARQEDKPVGFLILTPIQGNAWQIKNALAFPHAPRGTSEKLIYTSLKDLHREQNEGEQPQHSEESMGQNGVEHGHGHHRRSSSGAKSECSAVATERAKEGHERERVTVTFGISASDEMEPVGNLSGWKVTALSKLYGKVASTAGLLRRGEYRSKFQSEHDPMYVCYPEDGFGLDGVNALLKLLAK